MMTRGSHSPQRCVRDRGVLLCPQNVKNVNLSHSAPAGAQSSSQSIKRSSTLYNSLAYSQDRLQLLQEGKKGFSHFH